MARQGRISCQNQERTAFSFYSSSQGLLRRKQRREHKVRRLGLRYVALAASALVYNLSKRISRKVGVVTDRAWLLAFGCKRPAKRTLPKPPETKAFDHFAHRGFQATARPASDRLSTPQVVEVLLQRIGPSAEVSKNQTQEPKGLPRKYPRALRESLEQLNSAPLKEQVVQLAALTNDSCGSDPTLQRRLLKFATEIAGSKSLNEKEAQQQLAKLCCLLNRDPEGLRKVLDQANCIEEFLEHLNNTFHGPNGPLAVIKSHVERIYQAHKACGLQSAERAVYTQLPPLLAKLLINDNGSINHALADVLKKEIVPPGQRKRGPMIHLYYGLKMLHKSADLRNRFNTVVAPADSGSQAARLIRFSLGYGPGRQITDVDAKRVALAAMLSHTRQGRAGNCFAVPLALGLLRSRLGRCVDDFAQLLCDGQLTRQVNEKTQSYPFIMRMSRESCHQRIRISPLGECWYKGSVSTPLWLIPGIQSACRAIGLSGSPCAAILKQTAQTICNEKRSLGMAPEITVQSLLNRVAESYVQKHPECQGKEGELAEAMLFAFEGETQNPLLAAWQNALASMPEGDKQGLMRERLLKTVLTAVHDQLEADASQHPKDLEQLLKRLGNHLSERISLAYDPSLPSQNKGLEGGYVLYDNCGSTDVRQWRRCDSPERFQEFLQGVIAVSTEHCSEIPISMERRQRIQTWLESLHAEVATDTFLRGVMERFDHGVALQDKPIANAHRLSYTPWRCVMGNNPQRLFQVYWELPERPQTHLFSPQEPEQLLIALIDAAKGLSAEDRLSLLKNPYQLVPVSIRGKHAFSLTFGHKSLARAWASREYTPSWIDSHLKKPGMTISNSLITHNCRQEVFDYCRKQLLRPGEITCFNAKLDSLSGSLSLKDFREELLKVLNDFESCQRLRPETLAAKLDTQLYRSLPEALRQQIWKRRICFADSNWSEGGRDIYAAMVFNPFTAKVEIWKQQGNELIAAEQSLWQLGHQWEFHTKIAGTMPSDGVKENLHGEKRVKKDSEKLRAS